MKRLFAGILAILLVVLPHVLRADMIPPNRTRSSVVGQRARVGDGSEGVSASVIAGCVLVAVTTPGALVALWMIKKRHGRRS